MRISSYHQLRSLARFVTFVFALSAQGAGSLTISVKEDAFEKTFATLAKAGALPLSFEGKGTAGSYKIRCVEPIVRFPKAALDGTDLSPRIILGLTCEAEYPDTGIKISCPYKTLSEIPENEWTDPKSQRCAHIQAALKPILSTSEGKTTLRLSAVKIERLSLIPANSSFDRAVVEAGHALEELMLRKINQSLGAIGNPWFNSILPIPLEIASWKSEAGFNQPNMAPSTISFDVEIGGYNIDLATRIMRLQFLFKSKVTRGGAI